MFTLLCYLSLSSSLARGGIRCRSIQHFLQGVAAPSA
jgi:hypothetical protein